MTLPKKNAACKGCKSQVTHTFKQMQKGKVECIGMCDQCPLKNQLLDQTIDSPACAHCNTKLYKIETTQQLGCLHCLEQFKENCLDWIEAMNVSEFTPDRSTKTADIEQLQLSLQQAIANELFEEAALIRDRLKQLSLAKEEG